MRIFILLSIFLYFTPWASFSQEDTTHYDTYKVVTTTGKIYVGKLLSDDGREILIETQELGKIYIAKSNIESMKKVDQIVDISHGNLREAGPFTTRYYFTNNALPITKGEDYAMIHLYGPEVHFALNDQFSLGVMSSWMASPIGLAAKYSLKTSIEKLHLSVGTIMFSSGYLYQAKAWGGLHWGSLTYGVPGKNMTFSSGFGYVDLVFNNRSRFEKGLEQMNRASVSSIAGIFPAGDRASFIFDSMIAISEDRDYTVYGGTYTNNWEYENGLVTYESGTQVAAFLMPGMRFQKNERRAFQVALAGVIYYSTLQNRTLSFPVPMCSWFFKF